MDWVEIIKYLNNNGGAISLLSSIVVMIATVIYAVLTAKLVTETRKMRELQTEPRIEVVAKPLEQAVNILVLNFKNIGLGPAYNLRFNITGETGSEGEIVLINEFSKCKFIERGLSYLSPNQEISSGYTQLTQGFEQKIKARLNCEISFENYMNKRTTLKIPIYLEQFEGYGTIGTNPSYKIAQALDNLDKNIAHAMSGFKKLNVKIFTEDNKQ